VVCPFFPADYEEDWGLDDPRGKSDEEFKAVIRAIEENILKLAEKIRNNTLS
jgi:arsenate reductase